MGAETTKLSISLEANDALKKVSARFPEWSLARLGDKLLLESCQAILSEKRSPLHTIDYIRQQIGADPMTDQLETIAARIEEAAAAFGEAKKQQAARKHAA
jgi:hypothetical protein